MTVLTNAYGHSDSAEEMIDEANGDSAEFIRILKKAYNDASPQDKAATAAKYEAVKKQGVIGEITFASLKAFVTALRQAKIVVPAAMHPSDSVEGRAHDDERHHRQGPRHPRAV